MNSVVLGRNKDVYKRQPLSRKETAKLIATGKTAPLPLDEISDALSMDNAPPPLLFHREFSPAVASRVVFFVPALPPCAEYC